ncbi:hypothetical protein B8W85_12480, partial [Lentilactobacillus kefiri]|jgi:hypothetical protein
MAADNISHFKISLYTPLYPKQSASNLLNTLEVVLEVVYFLLLLIGHLQIYQPGGSAGSI